MLHFIHAFMFAHQYTIYILMHYFFVFCVARVSCSFSLRTLVIAFKNVFRSLFDVKEYYISRSLKKTASNFGESKIPTRIRCRTMYVSSVISLARLRAGSVSVANQIYEVGHIMIVFTTISHRHPSSTWRTAAVEKW